MTLFARTKVSLLGNAWQAVAQVAVGEAREVVHKGMDSTDEELEKLLGSAMWKERRVKLAA